MGWADSGKTITWILGPVFRRLSLDKAFPPPKAEKEDARKPRRQGREEEGRHREGREEGGREEAPRVGGDRDRRSSCRAPRPTARLAYQGARLVTMKGDEVVEHGTIVVEDNRIKAVGANVAVPPGARREARPRSSRPP